MIPLTVRSHYSLMWGTAPIKQLCRSARRMGYRRLALTDTDNLYGLWPFLEACRREGLDPIVGSEITDPHHCRRAVCLVKNTAGYANLCRLITQRHRDPAFQLAEALGRLGRGLIVLTQNTQLLETGQAAGLQMAAAMPRRPLPPGHRLRKAARRLGVPLVATPGSFFLAPQEAGPHRLLRAIDRNTSLSRLPADAVAPADAWLAPPAEYRRRFAISPQALSATHALAEQINFRGPDFGLVMPPWESPTAESTDAALRRAAYAGAHRRYGGQLAEPVVERLEQELAIIARMGFSSYFLVVRDIVAKSPRTCGRGSGAASLVAYCLHITNVCPLKYNLYFSRFLNPGRSDAPDMDVDFAWDERDGVIATVLDTFAGRAAMVASHVLIQPRMALREVAKVYGLTDAEIGKVAKRLPYFWRSQELDRGLLANLKRRPETRHLDFIDPWPEILQLAQQVIGTPRYLSVHPGGVVITPAPIDGYVPVETAPKGVAVIQWEKDATETAGLVKIDLLGNRSLGVIRDAVANVHANQIALDEVRWEPEADFETQSAVAQGRTMGCFYIESPAMRLLQQKTAVGDFDHLVIHSSIIRPAANDFIQEYIRRLHGGPWKPIHPLLSDVLDETFGIMVYQEDVSRTAVALAGFSDVEADGLRKIMSKKDKAHIMEDYRARFTAGARARGVSPEQIASVWQMIISFSGYSFCKPHSASYARVSFQAAYLKVHHPAEFMAAVINNQGGFYSTFAYVSEARRMGLAIAPPDIHRSRIPWQGQGHRLQVGLMAVKGLSAATQQRVMAQRRQCAFTSLEDFLQRVQPEAPEARALIHCGALDAFNPSDNRAHLLWQLALWHRSARARSRAATLFEPAPGPASRQPVLPPEDPVERLRREFRVLGFLCQCHPMTLFAKALNGCRTVKAADLPRHMGRRVRMAGWLVTGKVVHTRHGEPMEFLTFEDETGIVETTFFPEAYRRFCHMIDRGRPYLLHGKVEQDWGATTLTVERAIPLAAG